MGNNSTIKALLAVGVGRHSDPKDKNGHTLLSLATQGGHIKVVKLLLGAVGTNADSKDEEWLTPLAWAAIQGHEMLVELLLKIPGVVPNSETDDPWPGELSECFILFSFYLGG